MAQKCVHKTETIQRFISVMWVLSFSLIDSSNNHSLMFSISLHDTASFLYPISFYFSFTQSVLSGLEKKGHKTSEIDNNFENGQLFSANQLIKVKTFLNGFRHFHPYECTFVQGTSLVWRRQCEITIFFSQNECLELHICNSMTSPSTISRKAINLFNIDLTGDLQLIDAVWRHLSSVICMHGHCLNRICGM